MIVLKPRTTLSANHLRLSGYPHHPIGYVPSMIWFDFPKIGELAIAMFTSLAHGHFNLDTSPTYEIGQAASNSPSSTLLESRLMGGSTMVNHL
jgi:hypothetical protein